MSNWQAQNCHLPVLLVSCRISTQSQIKPLGTVLWASKLRLEGLSGNLTRLAKDLFLYSFLISSSAYSRTIKLVSVDWNNGLLKTIVVLHCQVTRQFQWYQGHHHFATSLPSSRFLWAKPRSIPTPKTPPAPTTESHQLVTASSRTSHFACSIAGWSRRTNWKWVTRWDQVRWPSIRMQP